MATHRGTWKAMERMVARFFRTKRNPLSGSNSKHSSSDTLHPDVYVECKYRARMDVWTLYKDTAAKAKKEGKIPVVILKQKGEKGFLIVCEAKHLHQLAEESTYERPSSNRNA